MYRLMGMAAALALAGWIGTASAEEKTVQDIPKDAVELGTVWTEPVKGVARETRRLNPVSGLWHGLWQGSVKSLQRTAEFIIQDEEELQPGEPAQPEEKPLLKYSF